MGAKKRHDDMLVQMKLTRKDLLEDIEVRRRMRWADQIREEVNPVLLCVGIELVAPSTTVFCICGTMVCQLG